MVKRKDWSRETRSIVSFFVLGSLEEGLSPRMLEADRYYVDPPVEPSI